MKKWFERYQNMRKDPKGKAILFFGFYFIFFTVIIALLRFSSHPGSYQSDDLQNNNLAFEVDTFTQDNYHFHYTVLEDNHSYIYDGKKNGVELFTFQDQEYYFDGTSYYLHNGIWFQSESPYLYSDFLDTSKIVQLLQKAYFESETTYKSGKTTYHFLLDTNLIYQLLFQKNTDYEGNENALIVNVNENKKIESIIFDLVDYCKSLDTCQNTLKISLEYDEIGLVGEIESPIEKNEKLS